jgi:predicted unusual protein kinase regulating ubiquinone biosynthesis (AarF/ABC1/UbiB family)
VKPPESDDRDGRVLPESTFGRGARLLSLPLGVAARAGVGAGRRLIGGDAAQIDADLKDAAAEQLFSVLGELKGGAMKFGQMLSMFEAMLPEDLAAPFRARLRQLQDSAPPMPSSRAQSVLRAELGSDWRSHFAELDLRPAAAASIGQVHRGRLTDGTEVAVKIQYPGADNAIASDLRQIRRLTSAIAPLTGGVDLTAIAKEMAARVTEEVDYALEAEAQAQVAEALAGHPRFVVPRVHLFSHKVLVSDWIEGRKLTTVIDDPPELRNRVALDYVTFLFAGPRLAGILHGDPHPGNYLITGDGKLGVVDFGLVSRLPDGLPRPMGTLIRNAVDHDAEAMVAGLATEGFISGGVDATELLEYLSPFVEPASVEEFAFNREWSQSQFVRVHNSMQPGGVATRLNIPPIYTLIYRAWLGGISVLSQLDVKANFAAVLRQYLPGFAQD